MVIVTITGDEQINNWEGGVKGQFSQKFQQPYNWASVFCIFHDSTFDAAWDKRTLWMSKDFLFIIS